MGRLTPAPEFPPFQQADRLVVPQVSVQAETEGQIPVEDLPVGHAPQLDLLIGMLMRARIERGQEDLAGLGRQFQVGRDVEEVAREPRRIHRHHVDLLQASPEIPSLRHDFENAAEQVIGVTQLLERLSVKLTLEGWSRLGGVDE